VPRVKEYQRDDVLCKAVNVFWQKGFTATSMSDLVEATGLNTASMYKEFGSKEGLFSASLENFYNQYLNEMFTTMMESPSLEALELYFRKVEEAGCTSQFKGCLYLNALAERDAVSQQVVEVIEGFCSKLESIFTACIRDGQAQGHIPDHKDADQLARALLCFLQGFMFYAKSRTNKQHAPAVVTTMMEMVTG
tara:strand:+ start:408 stop:986 length:579 start_codon:yes stop_codon:yes gene_type:complete